MLYLCVFTQANSDEFLIFNQSKQTIKETHSSREKSINPNDFIDFPWLVDVTKEGTRVDEIKVLSVA